MTRERVAVTYNEEVTELLLQRSPSVSAVVTPKPWVYSIDLATSATDAILK